MDKEEILKKSREENECRDGEYERSLFAKSTKTSRYVGFAVCLVLAVVARYLHKPEVAFAGLIVLFSMQAGLYLAMFSHIKEKIDLIFGIICSCSAITAAGALVYLWMTSSR